LCPLSNIFYDLTNLRATSYRTIPRLVENEVCMDI
jgi:hypothetical protein